jgi:hypothetical protein
MLCVMLSELPEVVALNEGLTLGGLNTQAEVRRAVEEAFRQVRHQILTEGTAPARNKDGQQVSNHFVRTDGDRTLLLEKSNIAIEKPLGPDFMLAFKHNAIFTLALEGLVKGGWPVVATVRNPLAVLGSWNTLNIPVAKGRMRGMEKLQPNLATQVEAESDLLDQQVLLLDYYFQAYNRLLPAAAILTYERLCAAPAEAIQATFGLEANALEPVEDLNRSDIYPQEEFPKYFEALMRLPDAGWRAHYSEEDLKNLMS